MNASHEIDDARRQAVLLTGGAAAIAVAATAVPFAASLGPSERARAAGASVEVDVAGLEPGRMLTVEWRGKPVWILRRTPEMLRSLQGHEDRLVDPGSGRPQQPEEATNAHRSIRPEYLVVVGICTHLGCAPAPRFEPGATQGMQEDWPGGYFCPCHGSVFDLAGRVFKDQPAPTNLEVPPHAWLSDSLLRIGEA